MFLYSRYTFPDIKLIVISLIVLNARADLGAAKSSSLTKKYKKNVFIGGKDWFNLAQFLRHIHHIISVKCTQILNGKFIDANGKHSGPVRMTNTKEIRRRHTVSSGLTKNLTWRRVLDKKILFLVPYRLSYRQFSPYTESMNTIASVNVTYLYGLLLFHRIFCTDLFVIFRTRQAVVAPI